MRVRHVLIAVVVLCLLASTAGLLARTREMNRGDREDNLRNPVTIERADLLGELSVTAKAGSLLAMAEELLVQGKSEQAISILNRVVRMDLPESREADKIVTTAYVDLGRLYDDPAVDPTKSIRFYSQALERMSVDEDRHLMIETLESLSQIHFALGNASESARLDALALDVGYGDTPVDLGLGSPDEVLAPLDPGDDTCDASIPVTLPHMEQMSISPAFDQNWRDFTLSSPKKIRIETLDPDTSKDTTLALWLACEGSTPLNEIDFDDDGGPGFLSLIESPCLEVGTYWVEVAAFFNRTPEDFTLSITEIEDCVIAPPDEFEPDNEFSSATRIGFRNNGVGEGNQFGRENKNVQRHTISWFTDFDWVKFSLSRPNFVNIETFGVDGEEIDTLIGTTNSGGTLIAVNDDKAPGDLASRLSFCLPPGDWFVPMLAFEPFATFEYDIAVDVEFPCLFESEPNGTCFQANSIDAFELWNGLQTPGGLVDNDWYTFTIEEEQLVTIENFGYDDFDVDTFLELWDGCAGSRLAADDDSGPGFLAKITMVLPAGTYYVNSTVSPFDEGDSWPYSLSITLSEAPQVEMEPNDNCAEANAVAFGDSLLASISPVGDKDFFRLTVPAETFVEIETNGESGDTVLDISAVDGEPQIGCDDDAGDGLFSKWGCCLPAGDYCVGVKEWGNNGTIGSYTIDFRDLGACTPSEPLECPRSSTSQCDHPF